MDEAALKGLVTRPEALGSESKRRQKALEGSESCKRIKARKAEKYMKETIKQAKKHAK